MIALAFRLRDFPTAKPTSPEVPVLGLPQMRHPRNTDMFS